MRREIKKGYIKVAYGYDDITGHFLSVYDTRLQFQHDAPAEANKIANQVDEKQGFAGYFELHTGMGGFGFHTSVDTMVYYWTLYGVPKDDVERARTGLMVRDYYRRLVRLYWSNIWLFILTTTSPRQARDSTSPPQPISKVRLLDVPIDADWLSHNRIFASFVVNPQPCVAPTVEPSGLVGQSMQRK